MLLPRYTPGLLHQMVVFHLLCNDKHLENVLMFDKLLRSCAWIGSSNPCITHDSMLLTILSMSDCHGICFLIIDSGVLVDTSALGICVYSIPGGIMVLTGCISKSGCFSDNHCKAVCTGVNGCD